LSLRVKCITGLTPVNGLRLRSDENCQPAPPHGAQLLPMRSGQRD